jgi:single-stranded-DNA-specific exonuclease
MTVRPIAISGKFTLSKRPAIVIGEGGKGSGRSIPSFHLHEALVACASHLQGFGGHAHAAGVQLNMETLDGSAEAMNRFADTQLSQDDLGKTIFYDQVLGLDEISFGMIADLSRAAPYGRGNPEPVFRFNNVKVRNLRILKEAHVKAECVYDKNIDMIGFGMAEKEDLFIGPVDMLAVLQINRWRGQELLQFALK